MRELETHLDSIEGNAAQVAGVAEELRRTEPVVSGLMRAQRASG